MNRTVAGPRCPGGAEQAGIGAGRRRFEARAYVQEQPGEVGQMRRDARVQRRADAGDEAACRFKELIMVPLAWAMRRRVASMATPYHRHGDAEQDPDAVAQQPRL